MPVRIVCTAASSRFRDRKTWSEEIFGEVFSQ